MCPVVLVLCVTQGCGPSTVARPDVVDASMDVTADVIPTPWPEAGADGDCPPAWSWHVGTLHAVLSDSNGANVLLHDVDGTAVETDFSCGDFRALGLGLRGNGALGVTVPNTATPPACAPCRGPDLVFGGPWSQFPPPAGSSIPLTDCSVQTMAYACVNYVEYTADAQGNVSQQKQWVTSGGQLVVDAFTDRGATLRIVNAMLVPSAPNGSTPNGATGSFALNGTVQISP